MAIIGDIEARLHADVSQFIAGMRQAQQSFTQTASTISQGSSQMAGLQSSVRGVQGAFSSLNLTATKALGFIGAGFILPKIFMAAKGAIIDFNQQVDQATVALTNFLGSASASKEMITDLQQFAAKTPFQFSDLLGTTQQMMAMGVAAEDVLPRMQAIGDAAAAMGGSPETLKRIQRALGQIQAKGKVQAEELMQLAEAGIPAYQYVADAMGVSTMELMDSMKKGAVDSTTAINGLLDGMANDFGGMMEEQSKTMMGAMSTVMDYVEITVGAIFRPFFETLRDAFVALAGLLGSTSMTTAAANFASGIAEVINSIKALLGAFAGQLKAPFMSLMKSMGDLVKIGLRIGKALRPMVTAVFIPLGLAVIVIAKALTPLIKMLTGFLEIISRNSVVVYALAGLLMGKMLTGLLATKMAAGGLTGAMTKMMQAFGTTGKIAAFRFATMRDGGVGMAASLKGAFASASFSVKAFGLAVKTVLIELLPLIIAFMVIGKAMEAFSNRNKDANERTKELTEALKAQTEAAMLNENALISMQNNGLKGLNDALSVTGKEGEETTNALIGLGKSSSDYLSTMVAFKKNTKGASDEIARQNGFTAEQANQIASYVKANDKGSDSNHRASMVLANFTPAMIEAAMALEQLDDASENTNIKDLIQVQIDATIRANEATKAFYDQAKAQVAAAEAAGHLYTEDERALAVYESFITASGDYERAQLKAALAGEQVVETNGAIAARMQEMIATMKDGKLEAEQFLQALLGAGTNSAVNIKKAYFQMGVALKDFAGNLKDTAGNQNALQQAGYDFQQMVGENSASIIAMGGSLGDVDAAMIQQIASFYKAGKAAGHSKTKIDAVLKSVGLLKDNGDINLTVDIEVIGLEKLKATALALGDTQMFNAVTKSLYDLEVLRKKNLNLDLLEIGLGGGSGGGKAEERYKKFLEYMQKKVDTVKDHLDGLKSSAEDLRSSIVDSVMAAYSFSEAFSVMQDTQNAFNDANKELTSAQEDLNTALKSRDLKAYNDALTKIAEASNKVAEADQNRLTFMQALTSQYDKAVKFNEMLTALENAGLNDAGLRQIIAAGAETGTLMGKELLDAGSDEIKRANTMYDTLKKSAKDNAVALSGEYYKSGIDMATQLLKGIKDTVSKFKIQLKGKSLSSAQLAKMKKDFDIKTEFTMSTVKNAESAVAMASGGIVMPRSGGTLARIGEAGYPEAVIPLNRSVFNRVMPDGGGSANVYEIHVHTGVGDPQEIGRTLVDYLQAYERRFGSLPLKVKQ